VNICSVNHVLQLHLQIEAIKDIKHFQNVKLSGCHMQTSQTLWSISQVFLCKSLCPQASLTLRTVLIDIATASSSDCDSTCSYISSLTIMQCITYRILKWFSSWDLCAAQQEALRATGTLNSVLYVHSSSSLDPRSHNHKPFGLSFWSL